MTKQRIPLAVTAERKVLPFIKKFIKKNGFAPSHSTIGENFDKSKEWSRLAVDELIALKLVKRTKGSGRQRKITVQN